MAKPMFELNQPAQANLTELIEVQPNATVSKQLLAGDNLRLILFSMDSGQELSEHRSPFTAMIHCLDGDLWVKVGDGEHTLTAGGWLLMPANAPHALRANGPTRFVLTMVR
jgi:quercetin dioxygenase-like cupin family protein